MRIAYLHHGSVPSVHADGVHVMRMCDAFADAGHEVALYALRGAARTDVHACHGTRNRFAVCAVPAPAAGAALGPLLRARRIRDELLRRGVPDLLYGRDPYALLAASGLAPLVYETHALRRSNTFRAVERMLFRTCGLTRVVFVTQDLADDYHRAFPELARSGVAAVTAADCADPPPAGPVAALPGRPRALRAGYVGRPGAGREADVVLALAARLPGLDFHLVGGSGADRSRWEHRCRGANVHVHAHRPPSRLDPYRRAFDIALLPYQPVTGRAHGTGPCAMDLFASMAHGKAIVASDLPALREVLSDGVDCLLRPPDDVAAWAEAVTRLAADPGARAALGEAAHRRLTEHHTWRARADRVLPTAVRPP
ncbi:hypothetical protein AF335_30455 [Streptomyces eurocidicus]|uniref:D-inositol 3-phosphate glycosyltransferase n=1 Tax=Streptomyces eurocidicus TaxID=66423 RepID=A0A2N8NMV9_STREU|nr:glycosyltransferase family 4 protein [Streptomyces eurocidicus]MBB5118264.1 glycosyltransferase involved in cell wall biosynthesis [Streptomyces eurocidicus]MBF6054639.1 glycosyltransferase [Streptomyces eurocidicus]PNE30102.1 hypothetical protein AF335_30455 [Streptomyces eurocidicus]